MAKYFIDTEFLEGFTNPVFGKERHFIDLISIGIVAEDGREFYAISNAFDLRAAWNKFQYKDTEILDLPGIVRSQVKEYWLRENVLKPIWQELEYRGYREQTTSMAKEFHEILDSVPKEKRVQLYMEEIHPHGFHKEFSISRFKDLIKKYGKTNKQIAKEIIEFVNSRPVNVTIDNTGNGKSFVDTESLYRANSKPIFYGYYCGYDHVLLCSLFGTMMQLPDGFPRYMRDLKQMTDNWVEKAMKTIIITRIDKLKTPTVYTFDEVLEELKLHSDYPKQTNEHNAISDARWNRELYKFLTA